MAMKYVAFSFMLAIDSFGAPSIMVITRPSHVLQRGIAQEDEEHKGPQIYTQRDTNLYAGNRYIYMWLAFSRVRRCQRLCYVRSELR